MSTSPIREMADELPDAVESIDRSADGRQTVSLASRDRLGDALEFLLEAEISHLVTITGVDAGEEIDILYHLRPRAKTVENDGTRTVTLQVSLPKDDPRLRTVTDRIPGASMYERELIDMLGIEVVDHPNPERLLLPDDWEGGSPLRVDEEGGD
ncbi:NADH-quinone oxidoreductase subunit C [Halapricum hydrolyticum]|uniref:NADH-quinone oxidoreductase subunit C n=1 Tax=Halapricum hydrolyticum TaxID=2979991 RepID=A0AAE3LEX6_9EURY|nr:NADH-quinone oxidoreductase subunit C [Halapricum hydrolyticum]MCU4717496.1 NADH-quinone oxidoreductase subunit C [Halapricum hydrolyticum]MCU4726660.1 NADH-quinone oxidoreductase subunit C [Halapricum hydrolyticum]